jgi:hypothetical protein
VLDDEEFDCEEFFTNMTSFQSHQSHALNYYAILKQTERQRVSDGAILSILSGCESATRLLVLIWPQFGDFDSLEYAWWLQRESQRLREEGVTIRAVGIGDRSSGQKFCDYTQFPADWLFIDPKAELHWELKLYQGLSLKIPGLSANQNAWFNLMLMCAGIGSPETLAEVFRGYKGDGSIMDNQHQKNRIEPKVGQELEYLQSTSQQSFCEWKGWAKYYSLIVGDKEAINVAWSYPEPTSSFAAIKDYIAFYAGPMDACYLNGEKVIPQPGGFYGGWITSDVVGPFKGEKGTWGW